VNRSRSIIVALATLVAVVGAIAPAWATYPGTTNGRIAFGITLDGNTDVYSVLPNGAAARRLTDEPAADICPAYSADGKWVAWCGPGGIWLMKQNGAEKRQLTTFGAFPDISPDGSKVVFNGRLPAVADPNIFVVNVDGTGLTQLTTDTASDQFPAWSPDGSRIVFTSTRTGIPQLWLMDADGDNQTQLTFDANRKDQLPDWSPDGSQIAYVQRTAPVGGDIWVVNADGTDPHPLTSGPPDELGTAWSPDGTQIAYLNWTTRTVEVMSADGTNAHPIRPLGVQFVPAWQPRGTGLDDTGELSAVAGTGTITERPVPTASSQPVSIVAGPDGNLWFTELRGNKVARMTSDGAVTEFPIPTPNSQPDDMDVGPDGNLWFAEVLGNRIGSITPDGVISEFLVPTPNSRPTVVAAGPDGNLWFTERGTAASPGNKVGRTRAAARSGSPPAPMATSGSPSRRATGSAASTPPTARSASSRSPTPAASRGRSPLGRTAISGSPSSRATASAASPRRASSASSPSLLRRVSRTRFDAAPTPTLTTTAPTNAKPSAKRSSLPATATSAAAWHDWPPPRRSGSLKRPATASPR
jgi:Tol biopolymer transport system component